MGRVLPLVICLALLPGSAGLAQKNDQKKDGLAGGGALDMGLFDEFWK